MQKYIALVSLILLICMPAIARAQNKGVDGFEDGNLTKNPVWSGDISEFTVVDDIPNHLLQLDTPNDSPAYLSTPIIDKTEYWEFYIEFRGFEPSGSNKATVFLMSDRAELDGDINGYAIEAGESGDDIFQLVRYDGGQEAVKILSDTTVISGIGGYTLRVNRSSAGAWKLEVGKGYGGPVFDAGKIASDTTYTSGSYFGPLVHFTPTRSDKFYFDFKVDLPPFNIRRARVKNNQVDVTFNRAYKTATVDATDFRINHSIGRPSSVSFPSPAVVRLNYKKALPSKKYILQVQNIQDRRSEPIAKTTASFIAYDTVAAGDVIINEFMADPPDGQAEYVELKNHSQKYLNLQNWKIGDDEHLVTIINTAVSLPPHGYAVISADTTALFNNYGPHLYIETANLPSFNNSGDAIRIFNDEKTHIDSLYYQPNWGGHNVALERRSDTVPSIYRENFGNSPNAAGGSPGTANAVAADKNSPVLSNLTIKNKKTLDLAFSERLKKAMASDPNNFLLSNDIHISKINYLPPDSVRLQLSMGLKNNMPYHLHINQQQDIFGNTASIDTTFHYYKTSTADSGDVFINEFMYDPPDSLTEYIELYNASSKSLDLQNWMVNDRTRNRYSITSSPYILPPQSYVVLAPDKTLLQHEPAIRLLTLSDHFPSLNNSGDAIVIRRGDGTLLDSLSYTSSFGGQGVASERRTTSVPPVKANFGPSPTEYGTPGRLNKIKADTTAPSLTDFSMPNSRHLLLAFSEELRTVSAEKTAHYLLKNIEIRSASQIAADSVELTLARPLKNGASYPLIIKQASDIFGNMATPIDTTIYYYETAPADSGDVFINEFTYDPPEGSTEYVELYNPTAKSLNISGWTLNDNTGIRHVITHNRFIIPPNGYAVLAPDRTLQIIHPDTRLLPIGTHFPSLNNSGDAIVIRRGDGMLLDSLSYNSNFGGDQLAIERRSTKVPPVKSNFGNAPNGFGTPGAPNEITADTKPPTLKAVQIVNKSTIKLIFSEPITAQSATNRSNYAIAPSRGISLISSRKDTVNLLLSHPLISGRSYKVKVRGVRDIFGNSIAKETMQSASFIKFSTAQHKDIVINEILYQDAPGGNPEFVELYNRTKQNFYLSGWSIGDESNIAKIEGSISLKAGHYIVLSRNKPFAQQLKNAIYISDFPSLNNDEDTFYIQDENKKTIDSLHYNSSFGGSKDGKSAERQDPAAASNDAANFTTSTASAGNTPGARNAVYKLDKTAPVLLFARIRSDKKLEAHFSEFINSPWQTIFKLNDEKLTVDSFDPERGNIIILRDARSIPAGSPLTLNARQLSDVSGNVTKSTKIAVAQAISKKNVVINEILYDPINNSQDNKPDQREYIELRNIRNYAVSLEGIRLHDAPDEDGKTGTLEPVRTQSKFIPAHGTALIYAEDTSSNFAESNLAHFFDLSSALMDDHALIRINHSTLGLASSGDAIYLANKNGRTIDSVYYDENWQNQNLIDTKGIALERINPKGPSDEATNWSSSTNEKGGTPDQENSIFQIPSQTHQRKVGIRFSPNPFSPDGDGVDDNVFINYTLSESDYLITVRIYDRYGREVRQLTDGKPAGFKGSLIWDGKKDNGSSNHIGIYIVIFRAYDSAKGKSKAFKKTVVLARRFD